MPKVIVYIATSLDGFIARKDDDVSWLDYDEPGEDYGYSEFMKNVGTAVMGARTYEQSLLHPERLLADLKTYVLTRRPMPLPPRGEVEFYHGDLAALVARIENESDKDIYLVGGGQIVSSFLNAHLVDEILHFVVPILIADGLPLYTHLNADVRLRLVEAQPYRSGIAKLHYVPE